MSAKSLKFFGRPTTKWRPSKFFGKLNRNLLLMANIFKLYEYQIFSLMKIHNMGKIWFANKLFSLWKSLVWFTINGPSKIEFFNFCFFFLSKFQMTIVKNLIMDFEGSNEFLLCHKYFWSTHFWQWNSGNFLWNYTKHLF